MADVALIAHQDDAWLEVDLSQWLAERVSENDDLSEEFETFCDQHGYTLRTQTDDAIREWVAAKYGEEYAGPQLDTYSPGITSFFTGNHGDTVLSDDFGATIVNTPDGSLFFHTSGEMGIVSSPPLPVYNVTTMEVTDLLRWSDAYGECENGHRWDVDDATHMQQDGTFGSYRIDQWVTAPIEYDLDRDWTEAYVQCPLCSAKINFSA